MKVFLGGTLNGSKWRDYVIPGLEIDYFNPDVRKLDKEAYEIETDERDCCDYYLYVITPKIEGFFLIPEVVDDSNKRPEKTLYCFIPKDGNNEFNEHQIKSLKAIGRMIRTNGGKWLSSLDEVIEFLNTRKE